MLGEDNYIDDDALLNALELDAPNRTPARAIPADINLYSEDDLDGDGKDQEDIVVGLFRAWLNEKATPELLPFPSDVIFGIKQLLESQVKKRSEYPFYSL